jgi:Na+-driven multidrug efflux pump
MDEQERKFIAMTQPPVGGIICRLAVPCIISMLVTAFYNMADTFFVGMLKAMPPPVRWVLCSP